MRTATSLGERCHFVLMARPSNDTAVQRRAHEGATRPRRPAGRNGGSAADDLGGRPPGSLALHDVKTRGTRRALERLFRENGLPDAIRSDNGVPFASTGIHGLCEPALPCWDENSSHGRGGGAGQAGASGRDSWNRHSR
jgi:hypothetical protein